MKPVEKNYYEIAIAEAQEKDDFENLDILKTGYIEELKRQIVQAEPNKIEIIESRSIPALSFERSYFYAIGALMAGITLGAGWVHTAILAAGLGVCMLVVSVIYLTLTQKKS
jgi:hypothetical protein